MVSTTRYFLQVFDPDYIVDVLRAHPVVWHDPAVTGRGGLADQAGTPPIAAMEMFHDWVASERSLPFQTVYSQYAMERLRERNWPAARYEDAYIQKLEHNFYPSFVDQYHAFGLVYKAGWYQQCSMDSIDDVVGKADLTLHTRGLALRINLKGPSTTVSRDAERYKVNFRDHGFDGVVQVRMPMSRERNPGNKRWYTLKDFDHIQPTFFGPEFWGTA